MGGTCTVPAMPIVAMRSVVTPRLGTQSRTHTLWLGAIAFAAHGHAGSVGQREDQGVRRLEDVAKFVRTGRAE
jgi:hypothetical protein